MTPLLKLADGLMSLMFGVDESRYIMSLSRRLLAKQFSGSPDPPLVLVDPNQVVSLVLHVL